MRAFILRRVELVAQGIGDATLVGSNHSADTEPNTGWLNRCLALDEKGFIKTGADLSPEDLKSADWRVEPSTIPA